MTVMKVMMFNKDKEEKEEEKVKVGQEENVGFL